MIESGLPSPSGAVLNMQPIAHVCRDPEGGECGWMSDGEDPQFALELDTPMPAGWYRLTGILSASDAVRIEPVIYPDYGKGCSEAERIQLRYSNGCDEIDSVFRLAGAAVGLRLDPMEGAGRFRLGRLVATRVSETEASWLMLRGLLAAQRNKQPVLAMLLAQQFREIRRGQGVSAALDWLGPRYAVGVSQDASYAEWIKAELAAMTAWLPHATDSTGGPRFSLILCKADGSSANAPMIRDCIDSLMAQDYPYWELLVSSALSARYIDANCDPRIRIVDLPDTHLAEWLDRVVAQCSGSFAFPIHAGTRLSPRALTAFAAEATASDQVRILYSDEDFIDAHGERYKPWFKTDWDPKLAFGQDFFSGATAIEVGLLRQVLDMGRLQTGAEIYDVVLRGAALCAESEIAHVTHVLVHSVASETGPDGLPSRELAAGGAALAAAAGCHLRASGIDAAVDAMPYGNRLRMLLPPGPKPRVEIVVPTRDRADLLSVCIGSVLERTSGDNYLITIVDNGSVEEASRRYFEAIASHNRVRVLRYDRPFNYSAINNFAIRRSDADVIVLLNNDVEVIDSGWLHELVSHATQPGTGAVGAKLYYPDGTIQHAGVVLGVKGVAAHPYSRFPYDDRGYFNRAFLVQRMSAVTAACMAVRRSVLEEVGGLDESLAVAFNDVDLCLRIQAMGYRNVWTPHAVLYHHESATRGYEDDPVKQERFASEVALMRSRWGALLDDDPAYNPNLGLRGHAFDLDPSRVAPPPGMRAVGLALGAHS